MKKKVLIISYTYPPANVPAAQRPYALAKFLDKSKFDVTVITCSNPESALGIDTNFDETLEGVNLIKIKSKFSKQNTSSTTTKVSKSSKTSLTYKAKKFASKIVSNFVSVDKGMLWSPGVLKYIQENTALISSFDIVFTTSPLFTNHLIGRYIKNKFSDIKWIADFRDFHAIERADDIKYLAKKRYKENETNVIKEADKVVFISNAMKDVYASYYQEQASKFYVVYNGFDFDDFRNIDFKPVANDVLEIFYAGSFYNGERSPHPLLKVIDKALSENLLRKNEIKINIAGRFDDTMLEELKQYNCFSCITFLGIIPRGEVLKLFTTSSLLWLIVANRITHYTGVPIKFYEYLASRRPILNFAPSKSEPTKIIKEHNLGWNFNTDSENLDEHYKIFKEMVDAFKKGVLNNPLPEASIQVYTRKYQAKLMENSLM